VDGTGEVALAAARTAGIGAVTRLVRREGEGLSDGKGAALTAAPPEICGGEVVVVLDADARIGPGFVARIAAYVAAGLPAVTPRRRILDAGSSWLAGAQADEQAQDGELQRGRWASGGCSEFRGNGISVRRDALAAVGGWRAAALTEDIDLASRLAARLGIRVGWVVDAEVWEEPVRTWRALWRQRLRWAEGGLRRMLEHGIPVMTSPHLSMYAKVDFAAYGAQLLVPSLILGAVAGSIVRGDPIVVVALVATYLAAGGVLAFDALRWETDANGAPPPIGERLYRGLRGALFGAIWLAAIPGAMWRLATRRGAVAYDKMSHVGEDAADPSVIA
jgi:1,2-diacylglycerol 3-beta-glucosyltransferase